MIPDVALDTRKGRCKRVQEGAGGSKRVQEGTGGCRRVQEGTGGYRKVQKVMNANFVVINFLDS